ncbi:hypothetical protein [Pseudonocardia xishanensis]|uniref:Uncharacterized protein n=1 Tax=Pseudonocardia xishanensis TaxID=630995 RepID=A0ABP8REL2_9PSEU
MDVAAAHELLVRLAGRLPDDVLWRLRDWVAADAAAPVGALLPRALLRNRVGLTDGERSLLAAAAGDSRLVDAVLPLSVDTPVPAFTPGPELPDPALMGAMAVVAGHPGVEELRDSRRGPQRVLIVSGADRPWALTGTLQRLLRVHGDRTPCVEVLPAETELAKSTMGTGTELAKSTMGTGTELAESTGRRGFEPPAYHQAAIVGSRPVWTAPTRPRVLSPTS